MKVTLFLVSDTFSIFHRCYFYAKSTNWIHYLFHIIASLLLNKCQYPVVFMLVTANGYGFDFKKMLLKYICI